MGGSDHVQPTLYSMCLEMKTDPLSCFNYHKYTQEVMGMRKLGTFYYLSNSEMSGFPLLAEVRCHFGNYVITSHRGILFLTFHSNQHPLCITGYSDVVV